MYGTVEHRDHSDFHRYDNKGKFIFLSPTEWKILGNYLVEAWSEFTN